MYVSMWVIPIFLIITILTNGIDYCFENLACAGAFLSNPKSFFTENTETDAVNEMANSENVEVETAVQVSAIPDDIQRLINEAEIQYANSTNDGEITEKDYSIQNATSELDGLYVRNTTLSHQINIEKYLKSRVYADIDKSKPSVLIYHTHTTETYELLDRGFYTNERDSRSENDDENMIRIGEEICSVLEENGYITIHDKTVYDKEYSGAYDRSRESITKILKDNPSIQIVLDIHRDAIYLKDGTRVKPTTEINGQKTAQIMIISGCEDGNVTDFPNWEKNLSFAVQLQNKIKTTYPSLLRPLLFCSRKYNMDLTPCSLLIEIGTDSNTLSEAVYSANLFAQELSSFLEEFQYE